MVPTQHETRLPSGMTLQRRPQCFTGVDERPLLRDEQGRVLAAVEQWLPETTTGLLDTN